MIKIFRQEIIVIVVLMLITVGFTILPLNVSHGASDEEIEDSITKGIAWVASQQNADGSWGIESYKLATTGLVLIKLQDYARELFLSPFENNYLYKDNVIKGWKYVFGISNNNVSTPIYLHKQNLVKQQHGLSLDDPDARPNGYGICFSSGSSHVSYSTGICLMALAASNAPTRANDGGIDLDGDQSADTFFELAQDTVDWVAYAQGDYYNSEGGWGYSAISNQNSSADNSNSGYIVLGLAAAEEFGCTVPEWVKNKLNVWIDNIQDPVDGDPSGYDGGSYYSPGPDSANQLRTGNLIFEMTYYGDRPTDTRFEDAMDYIERHWEDNNTNPGWGIGQNPAEYQAMFCLMKGFEYSGIDYIDIEGDEFTERDWYDEFASILIGQQDPNGSWPQCLHSDQNLILSTTWALLTLEKVIPTEPPEPLPKPPVAEAGGPYSTTEGSPITFDASLSYDPNGGELEYRWDFDGDGKWDPDPSWYDEPKVTHVFGDNWIGMAILEVRKKDINETDMARDSALVTVQNVAPTLYTISNVTISKNETVTLAAIATDPGSDDLTIEWLWGYTGVPDNQTIYLNNELYPDNYPSLEVNPISINDVACCKFGDSGIYKVVIIVKDDDGAVDTSNISINVIGPAVVPPPPNQPPIATLDAFPATGIAPLNVSFIGSGYDIDGTILLFFWDFNDGITAANILEPPLNLSYQYPNHTFTIPGAYYVYLTVMDDDGATDTVMVTIQVKPESIIAERWFTVSGYVYETNTTVKLVGVGVSNGGVTVLTNRSGGYFLTVPGGVYTLNVSKNGYEPTSARVVVISDTDQDFYLDPLVEAIPAEVEEKTEYFWIWVLILIIIIGIIITTLIITRNKRSQPDLGTQEPEGVKPILSPTANISPGIGPAPLKPLKPVLKQKPK